MDEKRTTSGELAKALVAFQQDLPTVGKGKTAKVEMKSGGSYSYKYADLADIVKVAMPRLTEHGMAFTAKPRRCEDGSYELVGELLHESGESKEGALPIRGNSPQDMGSAITYMRRYLFGCLTGLVTDEDDDGAAATRAAKKTSSSKGKSPADPLLAAKNVVHAAWLSRHNRFNRDEMAADFQAWAAVPLDDADAEVLIQYATHIRDEGASDA